VRRDPPALDAARRELAGSIDRCRFGQFLLARQGAQLRDYAHQRGVRLMGDMPFFVSPQSADAWANPELFLLDDQCRPRVVAGVPPDYFSATGQLWGNPVYDWNALRQTRYRWWVDRLRTLLDQVHVIRLDHFRAFTAAWHVPVSAETAESGQWVPGPGADFFEVAREAFGGLPFVAEDLGLITDDVRQLRDQFQLPGMRVLQFAFDGDPYNAFLPRYYVSNAVVYTGTHDNDTTRGWYAKLPREQQAGVWRYLEQPEGGEDQVAWALLQLAWDSRAALAIAPLQDVLNLGSEARMNVPGKPEGNWSWRASASQLAGAAFSRLADLTAAAGRRS
jgi:4-alpha-glucanotransferase